MTRRAGEPPEDSLYRTSFSLRPLWEKRLKTKLAARDISLGEQIRRWIDQDDWLAEHTALDAAAPLFLHLPDGRQVQVHLVGRTSSE